MSKNKVTRPPLKYDARGRLIRPRQTPFATKLLIFLAAYLLINGLIFLLVTSRPRLSNDEPDTRDYNTAQVAIQVHSLLPLSSIKAELNQVPLELHKEGKKYIVSVDSNGTINVVAKSLNGINTNLFIPVNLLDETAPVIDQDSAEVESDYVAFSVKDEQSGVDYDSIYGVLTDGVRVKPKLIDKVNGKLTFDLPQDSLQVFVSDLSGNQVSANFTYEHTSMSSINVTDSQGNTLQTGESERAAHSGSDTKASGTSKTDTASKSSSTSKTSSAKTESKASSTSKTSSAKTESKAGSASKTSSTKTESKDGSASKSSSTKTESKDGSASKTSSAKTESKASSSSKTSSTKAESRAASSSPAGETAATVPVLQEN